MPFFSKVPLAPPDPILGLSAAYAADTRKHKVNLGVGLFKNAELRTPVLESVKEAEKFLLASEQSKEYLPIDGHKIFLDKVGELLFGKSFWENERERISGFQTVGGTGALKVGGSFLKEEADFPLLLPHPTWPNHRGVFKSCQLQVEAYPYYKNNALEIDQMLDFLKRQTEGSIVLLHACCHNPTGKDPTVQEWKNILEIVQHNKLLPFFDCAYQGFGKGLEEDAHAIRLFAQAGCELLVAFSAAKNFSLYGERVGALYIVSDTSATAQHVSSRAKQVVRTNYSNPPLHGAAIVGHILQDAMLKAKWMTELQEMRQRINQMRHELSAQLTQDRFRHLREGFGMFCFTGLDKPQVDRLIADYGIYLPSDGRINVCGLNQNNIEYAVQSILKVST